MKTLILDSAFKPIVVLCENGKVIDSLRSENEHNSDNYLLIIDTLLKQNNSTIDDIQEIAINVGPGSFTGLRVAISIAKGLGFETNVNFKIFSSFDFVDSGSSIVVIPGFSSFVYVKGLDGVMDCVDIKSLSASDGYITTSALIKDKFIAEKLNIDLREPLSYEDVLKKAKSVKLNELEPLYLIKSQAELQREEKLKNK